MKKFGVLWPKGQGERSVKRQIELLRLHGVDEENIDTENNFPAPRGDQPVTAVFPYLAPLGDDPDGQKKAYPHFLAMRFLRLVGESGVLHVMENDTTYSGVAGLAQLINDWVTHMRRAQTAQGRARGGRSKTDPKWYASLDAIAKEDLQSLFEGRVDENGNSVSAKEIASRYGTTHASLYRLAKDKNWNAPESFRGNQ